MFLSLVLLSDNSQSLNRVKNIFGVVITIEVVFLFGDGRIW
jgi:hypothetical protein